MAGSPSFPRKQPYQQKTDAPTQTHAANLGLGLMLQSRAFGIFQVKEQQTMEIFARTKNSLIYHMLCSFSKHERQNTQKAQKT